MKSKRCCVVIAGPTASGKSAFALDFASRFSGVIVNADSMQVYRSVERITASPSSEDRARVSHRLFGVLDPWDSCSAGHWLSLAGAEIENIFIEGNCPVIVGGTGFYLRALIEGLPFIPDIPVSIRKKAEDRFCFLGKEAFYREVSSFDPSVSGPFLDRQRLIRFWEVYHATGKPLSFWQSQKPVKRFSEEIQFLKLAFFPCRSIVYARCEERFLKMLQEGALEEVKALLALNLSPDLPIMKAVGIRELILYLQGAITFDEAVYKACVSTRRYAKRQMTWIRHQMKDFYCFESVYDPAGSYLRQVQNMMENK